MRKTIITALATVSLGLAAIGAQAQSTAPAASPAQAQQHQGHHGQKLTPEQRAAYRARRIARLHDELKITSGQEAAWKSFVATMQPPANAQRPDRAASASLTAPQRAAKTIELQKQRTAFMEQRLGALNSFYSVLSPEQKKTFDEKAARMGHRFHGRFGMDAQQPGATARG
jgi:protein CpxP